MKALKLATAGLSLFLVATVIGCGNPYQTASTVTADSVYSSPDGGTADISGADKQLEAAKALDKAQKASTSAQNAITDAQNAISALSDSKGNIALNLFTSMFTREVTANRGGLLSPLTNRLQTVFDKLFAKADQVKATINGARLALTVANAQLDLADPAQALVSQQILAQMAAIDLMEKAFKAGMTALAGKVDQVQNGLKQLVRLGTSFIPVPGLNYVADLLIDTLLLGDVTSLLDAAKLRLQSF